MNQELKEQAHKEFEEKKLVTGAMWLVKMWEKNKNNTEIEIELPEHIKDEFRYLIDSLINKTVQMTEERIVGVIKHMLLEINFLEGITGEKNREIVIKNHRKMKEYFSLITNKSDINK